MFISKYSTRRLILIKALFCFVTIVSSQYVSGEDRPHHRAKRVIDGNVVEIGKYPEIAYLNYQSDRYSYSCSATLIGARHKYPATGWVLTAAHCAYDEDSEHLTVSFKNQPDRTLDKIPIKKVYSNPDWAVGGIDHWARVRINDASLLKIRLPENIKPMLVSYDRITDNEISDGYYKSTFTAGYGLDEAGHSGKLLEAEEPLLSTSNCWGEHSVFNKLKKHLLCGGSFTDGGKGTFYGDSGGPFFITQNNTIKMIGVVSSGDFNSFVIKDSKGLPERETYNITYYTRTELLQDFIVSHMGVEANRLFAWETGTRGAARVIHETPVGICKITNNGRELIGTLDIDEKRCICVAPDTGALKVSDTDQFQTLLGNITPLYRWVPWSQDIPESALFNSQTIDDEPENTETSTIGTLFNTSTISLHTTAGKGVYPCLVHLSEEPLTTTPYSENSTALFSTTQPKKSWKRNFSIGSMGINQNCTVYDHFNNRVIETESYAALVHYTYHLPTTDAKLSTTTDTTLNTTTETSFNATSDAISEKISQGLTAAGISGIIVTSVVVIGAVIGSAVIYHYFEYRKNRFHPLINEPSDSQTTSFD